MILVTKVNYYSHLFVNNAAGIPSNGLNTRICRGTFIFEPVLSSLWVARSTSELFGVKKKPC